MRTESNDLQQGVATNPAAGQQSGRFAGKVAIVTGASDTGIGGSIARRLAAEGALVTLASREEPCRLLKRLARSGAEAFWSPTDVRKSADVEASIEQTLARYERLDVVVNNAGVDVAGRLEDLTSAQWDRIVSVNISGVMHMCQAALPHLTEPGGVIVNIASALALGACAGFSAYSASKAAIVGLTQSLAAEVAPRGLRVVAVAPAMVLTPMTRQHMVGATEDDWRKTQECHPLGIGVPDDVAAAVAFLASHEARWITGITLPLGWAPSFALPTSQFIKP